MTHDRLLIEVTQSQNFITFSEKIKEALELRYDYLMGLKGLRVTNIRIMSQMNSLKASGMDDFKSNATSG